MYHPFWRNRTAFAQFQVALEGLEKIRQGLDLRQDFARRAAYNTGNH